MLFIVTVTYICDCLKLEKTANYININVSGGGGGMCKYVINIVCVGNGSAQIGRMQRKIIAQKIGITVQGLKNIELGFEIPDVQIKQKLSERFEKTKFSQSVFEKLLNLSPSCVR